MGGTATVEIAPTLPDFAAQHATKKNAHSSTLMQSQQMFTAYPIQYAPPQYAPLQYAPPQYAPPPYYPPYTVSESLMSGSNINDSPLLEISVPSVEEFLKKLDKDEGDNGDFIQFIDAFKEQKITVKHIKDLDENEFQILGVKTIGWRKTIQTAAKQYK